MKFKAGDKVFCNIVQHKGELIPTAVVNTFKSLTTGILYYIVNNPQPSEGWEAWPTLIVEETFLTKVIQNTCIHSNTVQNQVLFKTFKYCRDCKEEV